MTELNETKDMEEMDVDQIEMTEADIIDKLLEGAKEPEKTYRLDRLGINVTLIGLTERELQRLRKECTITKKAKGKPVKELDYDEYACAVIEKATKVPNWNDPRILKKYELSSGREFLKRHLLGGEMAALSDRIMELSGFEDDYEEVKN